MSIAPVPTKSIILTDFDFTVDRTRLTSGEPHDGSVTIRMPGKNRKTANHELVFVPYFKKHKVKFKTVAIGKNKKKTQTPIVVFDHHTLGAESATIRKYEKLGGIVNSKGHAVKFLELFEIAIPERADEVVKVLFKLHPTQVNHKTLNYRICTVSLMKIIKNDQSGEKLPLKLKKRRIKKSAASKTSKSADKKEKATSNII